MYRASLVRVMAARLRAILATHVFIAAFHMTKFQLGRVNR
jgi:hypothetical protein